MILPYGIVEQYNFFLTFLNSSELLLHIQEPFCETDAILTIAVNDWETEHGSEQVRIQYYESDSCIKRVLTNKKSGVVKRIVLDRVYTSGWVWKSLKQIATSTRPGRI